jgi:outer membrane protein assembly factor BamA
VKASLGFGYDPFYSLAYENPALSYENDIGIKFLFAYLHPTNRSEAAKSIIGYDYQSKVFSQAIMVSKRFDQYNLLTVFAGFDYIEAPLAISGITASGKKIDREPILGLSYVYDSRDLKQFSRDGLYTFLQLQHKGFGLEDISYSKFDLDYREYRTIIGELAAKWRLNWSTLFGKIIPYYDYSYLGYFERVRGHSGDIREGKSYLLTSLEFSYPLLKDWNLHFKLPIIPQSLTSYRIEIYLTSFYDAGATYNLQSEIALPNFYSGYGLGLTFLILPYNAIRLEYARNELGRGEFLVGLGFSF